MEDKKETGYPVYAEDVLGGLSNVASAGGSTGLEPTPPITKNEAESYAELSSLPQLKKKGPSDKNQKNQSFSL